MAQKNLAYDHPAYLARLQHAYGQNAAGASTAFSKFVAFSALTALSVVASLVTAGTSTYTAWNGTATTTAINGDSFSVIRVANSAAIGATPALTTTTYGPYALSLYNGTATGTQTNVAGAFVTIPLQGTGGIAGNAAAGAGIALNQGDTLHILRGTDATAVSAFAVEYALTPYANVTS